MVGGNLGRGWMAMFSVLVMVMVSQVYTYPQTHGVAYIKYVWLSASQLHLNKVLLFFLKIAGDLERNASKYYE